MAVLANHARLLICIVQDPKIRPLETAVAGDLTERTAPPPIRSARLRCGDELPTVERT